MKDIITVQTLYKDRKPYAETYERSIQDVLLKAGGCDALGVWLYMLNKEDKWIMREKDVMNKCKLSRARYQVAVRVLKHFGLLYKSQKRDEENNQFTGFDTFIRNYICPEYEEFFVACLQQDKYEPLGKRWVEEAETQQCGTPTVPPPSGTESDPLSKHPSVINTGSYQIQDLPYTGGSKPESEITYREAATAFKERSGSVTLEAEHAYNTQVVKPGRVSEFATGVQNYLNGKHQTGQNKIMALYKFIRDGAWKDPCQPIPGPVTITGAKQPDEIQFGSKHHAKALEAFPEIPPQLKVVNP